MVGMRSRPTPWFIWAKTLRVAAVGTTWSTNAGPIPLERLAGSCVATSRSTTGKVTHLVLVAARSDKMADEFRRQAAAVGYPLWATSIPSLRVNDPGTIWGPGNSVAGHCRQTGGFSAAETDTYRWRMQPERYSRDSKQRCGPGPERGNHHRPVAGLPVARLLACCLLILRGSSCEVASRQEV